MASFLLKVLRNRSQSASTLITQLSKSQTQILAATPPPLPPLLPPLFHSRLVQHPPIFLELKREDSNPNACSRFYPTFSFEYFLNPISQPGFIIPSEDAGVTSPESPKIWADSVKKKRKRKMNKHKLQKLRKRLRRKT